MEKHPPGKGTSMALSKREFEILRLLAHPVRSWIYEKIGDEAVQETKLVEEATREFKDQASRAQIQHYLKLLEKAGLIGFAVGDEGKRFVYRKIDVRVQIESKKTESNSLSTIEKEFINDVLSLLLRDARSTPLRRFVERSPTGSLSKIEEEFVRDLIRSAVPS